MSTNGVNVEDTDMAECDGEKVVTMMDVLQEQQEFEEDANAVLGASDAKNCTYSEGYIKRQAIYACLTCCGDAKEDPAMRAGVCLACSLACHENHDLVELYTKRNFCCDCGNPKFNHPCQYTQNKTDLNDKNSYNQNFSGLYCICHRPYPDPEGIEEEMIQCIVCEDWLHASHLEATVPSSDLYAEMICKSCMGKNEFLHDYSKYAVNSDVDISMNESDSSLICNGDSKENGADEPEKGDCKGLEVVSELNEVKAEGDVKSIEMEKIEDNVITPEETNSSLTNNDDIKAEEQTEPKISVSEDKDDENAMESETALNNASENKNDVNDKVSGDKDLSHEQNATTASEQENLQESLEDLSETKEVPTADNIKDSSDALVENISNSTNNAEESTNISENNSNSTNNAEESTNNAETISNSINNTEESTFIAENIANVLENAENIADVPEIADVPDNAQDSNNIDTENVAEVTANGEDSTKVADNVADVTENAQASDIGAENMAEVKDNAEESTKVPDNVTDATDNVKELNNIDAENIANVSNIASDSTEGDAKNIASVSKEEKSDENITDNPPLPTIVDADAMETTESNETNETETETKTNETETNVITENTENGLEFEDNQIGSQQNQNDTSQHVDHSEDQDMKMEQNSNTTENKSSVTEDQTVENKRKHSIEETEDDVSVKKPKLAETCVKPKSRGKVFKGATFWPSHFRQKLCTCNECITMYKDLSVLFLIDVEDTVTAYEALGKERTDGTASTQYEQGLEALSSLGRIQQINALTEYNKMRDKLLDFLKSFKDRKEVVKEEDIKAFFAGMKPKREPDGVYFCR